MLNGIKKSAIGIAVLGALASAVHAEESGNSITVYGVADAAVGKEQHSLNVDSQFPSSVNPATAVKTSVPHSATGIFNGGISDSRLGFKGMADIGDGMKAFMVVEEGFNLPTGTTNSSAGSLASNGGVAYSASGTGSMNAQLFNRQAFVGMSDATLGSVSIGRQYAPIFDIAVQYDPVQNAQLFSPLGQSGIYGGGGGVSEDTRMDNSLKYSNKIGSFNFGTLYKFGGVAGQSSAKSGFALNAGYEEGNLGIQAAYEAFNDALKGASGAAANTVSVTAYDTKAFMIAAKYKIGEQTTVKAGYETFTLSQPTEAISLATTYYYGQTVNAVTNYGTAQKTNLMFVGGDYNFTDHFNLAAGLYSITADQSGDGKTPSGTSRYIGLLADYHYTKYFDNYLGVMEGRFSGPAYATGYYTSNYIVAAGMRYRF